jgi:hypothetical protein
MNIDKLAPGIGTIIAVLACIPATAAIAPWALVLVVIGLVHGLVSPVREPAAIAMIIAAAALMPGIADNLDNIPAIGIHLNALVDKISVAIAGYAVATLAVDIKVRVMGN